LASDSIVCVARPLLSAGLMPRITLYELSDLGKVARGIPRSRFGRFF
jgi:hypothetical protein